MPYWCDPEPSVQNMPSFLIASKKPVPDVWLAFGLPVVLLSLAARGVLDPLRGVLAQSVAVLVVVANSARILRFDDRAKPRAAVCATPDSDTPSPDAAQQRCPSPSREGRCGDCLLKVIPAPKSRVPLSELARPATRDSARSQDFHL